MGGALGLILAFWLRDFLWALRPPAFPDSMDISLDGRVLGFTFLLSVVTGVLFGLAPVLQMRRPNLVPALKNEVPQLSGTLRRANAGNLLVVTQVAISLLPLIGAGLFLRSLSNAQQFSPGFQVENEAVLSFDLGTLGYDEPTGKQFYRRVMERVKTLPGVENVAMAESLKLYPFGYLMRTVFMDGQGRGSGEGEMVRTNNITSTYFDTMRIPLVRGRVFTEADREGSMPVAVINETMAKRFWGGKDAVGQRFFFFGADQPTEVIGIVHDTKYQSLLEEEKPYIYVPLEQVYSTPVYLHVRTSGKPEQVLQMMRKEVQSMDPNLGLGTAWTMAEVFERNLWAPRLGAALLSAFGLLALCLAGIGIYGVMSYSVNQRRREIGIRMSLGARKVDVLRLMLQDGMLLVVVGLGLGLLAASAMGKSLSGFLFGLSGTDVGMFTAGTLILASAALCANYIAARRSTAVNPVDVLKS
jgi:macrolide transport system ATP-binding/permease protein